MPKIWQAINIVLGNMASYFPHHQKGHLISLTSPSFDKLFCWFMCACYHFKNIQITSGCPCPSDTKIHSLYGFSQGPYFPFLFIYLNSHHRIRSSVFFFGLIFACWREREKKKKKEKREGACQKAVDRGVAGDLALYVVTFVKGPFFPKTCEINEKKRKKHTNGCTWSPL